MREAEWMGGMGIAPKSVSEERDMSVVREIAAAAIRRLGFGRSQVISCGIDEATAW